MKFRNFFVAFAILGVLGLAACGDSQSHATKASTALQKGIEAQKAGNLPAAESFYREALKQDPQNKFAFFDLGLIYQSRGDALQAENNYRLSMSIDPKYTPPIYNMAILRRDAGNLNDSVDFFRRVIALEPSSAQAHYNLGLVLVKMGQSAEGNAEVAKAQQIDPKITSPAQPPVATPPR